MNPVVPKELTTYIVEAYVAMRQRDVKAPTSGSYKGTNQAVMTARQLLSILVKPENSRLKLLLLVYKVFNHLVMTSIHILAINL